ncbi:MAG TPA: endonuclease domain-containing protein [Dongiaceae bacterium]|jgi:very-short-patch-repair endonuclease|nr:endonuclease domain-containing protein [Dongiaceae bacterium]
MKKATKVGIRERARTLRRNTTDPEKKLWLILADRQMQGFKFRRQVPLGSYIADFACHEIRLIIELDGGQHDLSSPAENKRTAFLESQGYRVLRFWNNEVMANLEGVAAAIMKVLDPPSLRR